MPTRASERDRASTAEAAKGAAAHASAIARLEARLAVLEVKEKLSRLGLGPVSPREPR
jgi:hypothetical protein